MSYKSRPKLSTQYGFALVAEIAVIALVLSGGAATLIMVQRAKTTQQTKQAAATQAAAEAKLKTLLAVRSEKKATPTPTPAPPTPTSTPTPSPTPPTPKPAPSPLPKPAPTSTPTPPPAAPTTVKIGSTTYQCDESDNVHWKGLVYAYKAPTYSYHSAGGSVFNDYAQWTNITGLSCASTGGWLQHGSEFFNGQDLIVS